MQIIVQELCRLLYYKVRVPPKLVPCSCPACALLVPWSCPARTLLVPWSCPARTLLVPCSCLGRASRALSQFTDVRVFLAELAIYVYPRSWMCQQFFCGLLASNPLVAGQFLFCFVNWSSSKRNRKKMMKTSDEQLGRWL